MASPVRDGNPSVRSPAAVSRFGLPGPIWLLGWVSFVTDTASEMIYPLLPVFLTRVLGASAMSLGVIEGAAEAANSVLKIAAGRLSDRTGAPRRIVIVGYALSGAVRPLIALASAWTHVFALRFTDRLGKGIRTAPRDAMLAHFAPAHLRGRAYGFHRAMDHGGAVTGPLIASLFLFFFPGEYRTLFALTIVPGIIVVLILLRVPEISMAPRETSHQSDRHGPEAPQRAAAGTLPTEATQSRERTFRKALAVVFLFSIGNASDAFLLLRMTDLGIAAVWIPLLWSALHVVKVAASVVGGDLSDRCGRRALIAIGWLIYAAVYAGFGLVDSPAAIVAIFLSYGLYFGLTEGVEKAWIADLSSARARGTAFGAYSAVLGIGSLAASLLSGWIWTHVSPHAAFLTGAALALSASALLYLLFSHEEDPRHQR
jgi:MFS family permease